MLACEGRRCLSGMRCLRTSQSMTSSQLSASSVSKSDSVTAHSFVWHPIRRVSCKRCHNRSLSKIMVDLAVNKMMRLIQSETFYTYVMNKE